MANINIRDVPDDLYMEIKSECPLAGMGIGEYCIYILKNRATASRLKTLLPPADGDPGKELRDTFKRNQQPNGKGANVPATEVRSPVMSVLRPASPEPQPKHHPMCQCGVCQAAKK